MSTLLNIFPSGQLYANSALSHLTEVQQNGDAIHENEGDSSSSSSRAANR